MKRERGEKKRRSMLPLPTEASGESSQEILYSFKGKYGATHKNKDSVHM